MDAKTVLSRAISELGIYPAVDPLESTSRALDPDIVGEEHYRVAVGVQEILQQYKDLQDIIAILGMDELSEEQKIIVNRARKVQQFLGQNFHVAKQFTGQDGSYVKLEDTIRSFDEILKGNCDEIPEQCFRMKGGIEDVYAAYEQLKNCLLYTSQEEAAAIVAKAKVAIEAEKQSAISELKGSVVDLSVDIATRVIGEDFSDEEHRKLIERYVKEAGSLNA